MSEPGTERRRKRTDEEEAVKANPGTLVRLIRSTRHRTTPASSAAGTEGLRRGALAFLTPPT